MCPSVPWPECQLSMDFSFIYGSIPTSPGVFVLSAQFDVDADLVAGAVSLCMVVAAPLMIVTNIIVQARDVVELNQAIREFTVISHRIGLVCVILALLPTVF